MMDKEDQLDVDIQTLAAAAIGLLAEHLRRVGVGVAERIQGSMAERLYGLISARLAETRLGAHVLAELETVPTDAARQATASTALAEVLNADPGIAPELERLVNDVRMEITTGERSVAAGGINLAVARGGSVQVRRGVMAGGNVTQNRRISITFGGLAGVVVAAVVVGIGAGGAGVYATLERQPHVESVGTGSSPTNCVPRCATDKNGVTASVRNVAIVAAPDGFPQYRTLRFDWQIANRTRDTGSFSSRFDLYDTGKRELPTANLTPEGCNADFRERRIDLGEVVTSQSPACLVYDAGSNPGSVGFNISGIAGLGVSIAVPLPSK